ncbi:WD40-repeat-containing domain protein [Baffinella frigidus]|nr:WD40-repeat-containing domain protein [Cryptophyta sp. CCMP2293]
MASKVNVRRVRELVHHLIRAGVDEQAAVAELTSVEYIAAKFQAGAGYIILGELAAARGRFPNATARLGQVKSFIGRRLDRLMRPVTTSAAFQLAMQDTGKAQEPDGSLAQRSAQNAFLEPDGSLAQRSAQNAPLEPDGSLAQRSAQNADPLLRKFVIRWMNKPQKLEPCILTIKEHEGRVNAVAWSPDGGHIASASDDNTVKVCSTSTGEEVCSLDGHSDPVTSIAFSPDGRILASGSWDKSIRVWDPHGGKERRRPLLGHGAAINFIAFNSGGEIIASAAGSPGYSDNTIRLWHAHTGELIGRPLVGHQGTRMKAHSSEWTMWASVASSV